MTARRPRADAHVGRKTVVRPLLFPVAKRLQVAAQALKDAGGPDLVGAISPHTFRHSFAVNAILHGVPLTVVQAWLGHAHLSSTAIYTQVLAAETGHLMQWVEF